MAETTAIIISALIIITLAYVIYLMWEEKLHTARYLRKLEDKLYKCETGR